MNSLIHVISVFVYVLCVSGDTLLTNPIPGASYSCSGQWLNSTNGCSEAFDNNVNTAWMQTINSTSSPQYAVIALSSPMIVKSYQVYMLPCADGYLIDGYDYSFQVSSWTFEGSNDGSNYTILSKVHKYFPGDKSPEFVLFNCSFPASYKYYRFYVTSNWFIDNGYTELDTLMLTELQLILKDTSPTTLPTEMPSVFVRRHLEPPTSMPSTFLQSSVSVRLSIGMIILIAVVLIIGILLAAIFFWYIWSWYKLPNDNFLEASPEEKTRILIP